MTNFLKTENINRAIVIVFVIIVAAYAWVHRADSKSASAEKQNDTRESADTFIPTGYVLVPIEIENSESVAGLIEHFGIVDLYVPKANGHGYESVAEKIKLIRAPANPNQFAVLVRAEESKRLMQIRTSFWVVLQNRQSLTARIEDFSPPLQSKTADGSTPSKKNRKITVEYYSEKRL